MKTRKYFNVFIYIICLCLELAMFSNNSYAVGDGNIDGGGGGMGNGTNENFWNPGEDGVRVSIIRARDGTVISTPIDYTNVFPDASIISFGEKTKINYRNESSLNPQFGGYLYINPSEILPKIISSDGGSNIEAIKSYFTDEQVIVSIANEVGINFDTLIDGNYKLLLEPIAYFTFQGVKVAMTATEAALYDQQLSGGLRAYMVSLSHKNLPLAMFLEKPDLGYEAWSGSTDTPVSNEEIIDSLGLGIVRFNEDVKPPQVENEYRVNTDVITPVLVTSNKKVTPENPAKVTFKIKGSKYTVKNIVIPEGESQLVWCKWRTPTTPQTITISISSSRCNLNKSSIQAKVVDLTESIPPNPKANDRNDNFSLPATPNNSQKTSASWNVWNAKWKSNWKKVGESWEDFGEWVYTCKVYTATLSATSILSADSKVPKSSGKTMKSGYGVNIDVSTSIDSNAPNSHITGAQNVMTYFPEFNYSTYWRILENVTGGYFAKFIFKSNKYSTYNQRVHFTPVWYPNERYAVYSKVIDAWTPDGMLSVNTSDYMDIDGSVYSDWHIAPKK